MKKVPPLPRFMTLTDVAELMAWAADSPWTWRTVVGCCAHHDATLYARISESARYVFHKTQTGEGQLIIAQAGSLVMLGRDELHSLLLNDGQTQASGWDWYMGCETFGKSWQRAAVLESGQEPPAVRMEDCFLLDGGVQKLLDKHAPGECGASSKPDEQPQSDPPVIQTHNNMQGDILWPLIRKAQNLCEEQGNTNAVWALLEEFANKKTLPLREVVPEDGIKYTDGGIVKFFTKDALRKRLKRLDTKCSQKKTKKIGH